MNRGKAFRRREFVVGASALLATGLILPVRLGAKPKAKGGVAPNGYIYINEAGVVSFIVHRSEMGQWARTTCVLLLAEELRHDPAQVQVIQADGDERYGDQNTDGSKTVRINWISLRRAGAQARELLLLAAAKQSGRKHRDFHIDKGHVVHRGGSPSYSFQELVDVAAGFPIPANPPLLSDQGGETFVIGKDAINIDAPDMVQGHATYGIDVDLPGMVFASIARDPTGRSVLKHVDDDAARKVSGVVKVVRVHGHGAPLNVKDGVAVVATSAWLAHKCRSLLKLKWERAPGLLESSDVTKARLLTRVLSPMSEVGGGGGGRHGVSRGGYSATYYTPYSAHVPMEPPTATAKFDLGQCTVWAPTQDPQGARKAVAAALGTSERKVTIHVTLLGGAFGRKSQHDFVVEAALVARELAGRPVKVLWTREDDIRHGYYHAQCCQHLEATLDRSGKIANWLHRSAFPTIQSLYQRNPSKHGPFELRMGLTSNPYVLGKKRYEAEVVPTNLRIGWYRAVCENFHAFAVNAFKDELAAKAGVDPIDFRLRHLPGGGGKRGDFRAFDGPRMRRVIAEVRAKARWDKKGAGEGLGFACHFSFGSYVACIVRAELPKGGSLRVREVHFVVDCGVAINPDGVRAQMEGAAVFGISHTLHGEITVKAGAVEQDNFDNYPVLRCDEAPVVTVVIIPSRQEPTGIGETGVPVVAPAVVASYHALTGTRVRQLPLR